MNTKSLLISVLATAFVGAASATSKSHAELQQEAQLRAPSATSRAAVTAELLQARANGTLAAHPDYGTRAVTASSQLTRDAVLAQLNEARAAGTLGVHPDHGNRAVRTSSEIRASVVAPTARGV